MNNLETLARPGPDQSRWLTNAAQTLLNRDPLDALTDAETLVAALKADVAALLGSVEA
jgi:hypothetical protein